MDFDASQFAGWLDRIDAVGYRLFRRLLDSEGEFVGTVERKLTQAAIAEPVEMYLSRIAAAGLALGALSVGAVLVVDFSPLRLVDLVGWQSVLVAVIAGVLGGGLTVGAFLGRLWLLAGRRTREIDYLLPDAVAYMYALSTGGLNEVEVIESMAAASDTYGEVAREFQRIVQEMRYFDVDYRSAIRAQALVTPSDELAEFLTDFLSIINSGGDLVAFLDDKREKHMRAARRRQAGALETLELFGELYIALSLFPLLLIIVLVIMGIMGTSHPGRIYATVYGLIPIGNLAFLVLVSMVKREDPGDGMIDAAHGRRTDEASESVDGLLGVSAAGTPLEARIERRARTHRLVARIAHPFSSCRESPARVLWVTVPATIVLLWWVTQHGGVPTSWSGITRIPVISTTWFLFVPIYLNVLPVSIFYEWDKRTRRPITGKLSDTLRKLSSANDTGLSLLESIETVAETASGRLADELAGVRARVEYGASLHDALVAFNNEYHVPRLARTVKLIAKAQETSSQISDVLRTAAQASEHQDELDHERRSRTRLQVVIIAMTYLTMVAVVLVLKTQFLDVLANVFDSGTPSGVVASLGTGANRSELSLLLFHAITLQAVLSGVIAGYIREGTVSAGFKFVVALSTAALLAWVVIG